MEEGMGRGRGGRRPGRFIGRGGGRTSGRSQPLVTGPSRGDANDYCQHFVDTGQRPQNFLRDSQLVSLPSHHMHLPYTCAVDYDSSFAFIIGS